MATERKYIKEKVDLVEIKRLATTITHFGRESVEQNIWNYNYETLSVFLVSELKYEKNAL